MSKTINISLVLGSYLSIRSSVEVLIDAYNAEKSNNVVFDFSGVKFASRSFMDEFYNKLIANRGVKVTNMSDDLLELLNAVKRTQKPLSNKTSSNVSIQEVESVADLNDQLKHLSFI